MNDLIKEVNVSK